MGKGTPLDGRGSSQPRDFEHGGPPTSETCVASPSPDLSRLRFTTTLVIAQSTISESATVASPPDEADPSNLLGMKLEILTLCKAAVVEHGSLSILSAIDRLHASAVPCVLARCSVAIRIRFDRIESGEHDLKVHIVDADGKGVMQPLQAKLRVQSGESHRSAAICLVIDVNGLSLPSFGEYSIDLAVDSLHVGSTPFNLSEAKPRS